MKNQQKLNHKSGFTGASLFWRGVLSFFGAFKNPHQETLNRYKSHTVADSLRQDWVAIGNDFKGAIDKHSDLTADDYRTMLKNRRPVFKAKSLQNYER